MRVKEKYIYIRQANSDIKRRQIYTYYLQKTISTISFIYVEI